MSAVDLGALFLLGLVGSTHCLAMCSAFVLCVERRASSWQVGRLAAYASLGAVLALFGVGFRAAWDEQAGRVVLIVAGVLMIGLGLVQGGLIPLPEVRGAFLQRTLSRLLRRRSALALGLFTGLLPCPLLYAAFLKAAVSPGPLEGALCMAAFWLGTLPATAGLSFARPWLARHARAWWPRLALAVTVTLGALTLYHGLTRAAASSCGMCDM